jgi:preprotein translocase subunit SecE
MEKIRAYIQDSYNELMNKVSWPTWNELQSSAVVVLVATLIFGFVIFLIDAVFQGSLNLIYNLFV